MWDQGFITRAYDRTAPVYDLLELPLEILVWRHWRPKLYSGLRGHILEIGLGTGKNIPYQPHEASIVGIDSSRGMLGQATRRRAARKGPLTLAQADAVHLPFPDCTFHAAVASFVFCSVADPEMALEEVLRVLSPGGQLRLLEHQRPRGRTLSHFFDLFDPVTARIGGFHINRSTTRSVQDSDFSEVSSVSGDPFGILQLIQASKCVDP